MKRVGILCLMLSLGARSVLGAEKAEPFTVRPVQGEETEARDRYVDQVAMDSQREAIRKLKKLLAQYRGTPREPVLLMKLGELQQQDAAYEFRVAHGKSHRNTASVDLGAYKKSMNASIEHLTQLIQNFKSFEDMDLAVFMRGKAYQEIEKKELAKKDFLALVTRYPEKREAETAWMALAEYAIDENQHEQALQYLKPIEQRPESQHYPFALYKMAWSLYNLGKIPEGLGYLERQVAYLKKFGISASSDVAIFENSLSDIAMFYYDAYEKHMPGFEVAKALDYFKTIESGTPMGKMIIRFGKHLRASGKQAELVKWKNDLIEKEFARIETLDVARICFEDQVNKKLLIPLAKTSQDFVVLYKANPKMVETESYNATQKLLIETAEQFQGLTLKNKKATEVKALSATLSELYRSFIEIVDSKDPRIPKARYNLAETLFAINEFEQATTHYRWVAENWQGKKGFDAKIASIKAIGSRYESLRGLKRISEKLEARAIHSESESKLEKFAPLEEWVGWMDAHLKKYGTKGGEFESIENFIFEGDRALYAAGQVGRAVERMTDFAQDHSKSKYAVPAASLVLDTYVAALDWKNAYELSNTFLKIKGWTDTAFTSRVQVLAADSFFKLAEVAYATKDYTDALDRAEDCVTKYASSQRLADCRMLAARSSVALNKEERAERHYLDQIKQQPQHELTTKAQVLVGQIFERNFKYEEAAKQYEVALASKELKEDERKDLLSRSLKLYWLASKWDRLESLLKGPAKGDEYEKYRAFVALRMGAGLESKERSKELRALWSLAEILQSQDATYEKRVELLWGVAKGFEKLDSELQLALLPELNLLVSKGLTDARLSLGKSYKLRSTPKAIKLRVELIQQYENAVAELVKMPWVSVRALALNETADLYNDFTSGLRAMPPPENLPPEELAVFQETVQKLVFPFEEKAQHIREKAFELAQKGGVGAGVFEKITAVYFKESPSIAKQYEVSKDFAFESRIKPETLDRLSVEGGFTRLFKSKPDFVRITSDNQSERIQKNFVWAMQSRRYELASHFLGQMKASSEFHHWTAYYLAESGMQPEALAGLKEHAYKDVQKGALAGLLVAQSVVSRDTEKAKLLCKTYLADLTSETLSQRLESDDAWILAWAAEWSQYSMDEGFKIALLNQAKSADLKARSQWAKVKYEELRTKLEAVRKLASEQKAEQKTDSKPKAQQKITRGVQ